jgi:hypothetical protein
MMFAILIASALAVAVGGPSPMPPAQQVVRMAAPRPVVTGEHAVVPLEFTAGLPTFTLSVSGKSFRMGFDTGAPGGAHLTDRMADALALQPVGEALATDPSGENPVRIKLVMIPELRFGGLIIRNWIASSAPVRPGRLESLDGIVGLGAFDGYVVTLDYLGHRLLIDRGSLPNPDGRQIFSYSGDPIPVVPLTIEGRTILAHLDTGNVRFPVIVPASFADKLIYAAKARPIGEAHTISSVIEMKAAPVEGLVKIGDAVLKTSEAGFPSIIDLGNVGSLALSDLIVRIDPANSRISFTSPASDVSRIQRDLR